MIVKNEHIKLIALDIDGTLLNSRGKIPERNRDALRAASEQGVMIVLATGRMTDCISPFENELDLDCHFICYNGAMIRGTKQDGRPMLLHEPLGKDYSRELIHYCRGRYILNFYHNDTLYAEETAELREWVDFYRAQTGADYHLVPDLSQFSEHEPTKLVLVTEPVERERLYDEWTARWKEKTTIVRTEPPYLEFMNLGTDKGTALTALCSALGIVPEESMALGDGDNDAAMLAAAGLGVAMANATPTTRENANLVSEFTNDECGVAEAVEEYILS